jgi:hypothetical protein
LRPQINELPEVWLELRVVAETLIVVVYLFLGDCSDECGHDEAAIDVDSVCNWQSSPPRGV